MEDNQNALVPFDGETDTIQLAGQVANTVAQQHVLSDYHEMKSAETLRRQNADIALFEAYLKEAGAALQGMMQDLSQWKHITFGLVSGFKRWQMQKGYAIGSINVRLATAKTYCDLAMQAGYLPPQEHAIIRTVRGIKGTEGRNIDEKREITRVGRKKGEAVKIAPVRIKHLKQLLLADDTPIGRRDALLICLLADHGLRCGEVADLEANCIDLETGTMTFYRHKVHKTQAHTLTSDTFRAAQRYFEITTPTGKLFEGIHRVEKEREDGTHTRGKTPADGLRRNAINERIGHLGKLIQVPNLSPHDLRHYWATDASRNKTDIAKLQQAGGWSSPYMPLHYIEDSEIANQGVILS